MPCYILDNLWGQAEYGKESDVNGTLRAGALGAIAYAVENHPNDSRVNIDESGKVQTLTSRMGTGGGNVPLVMERTAPVYCLQGNGIDRADTAGCNGKGWRENESYTLNTIDRPAVVYALDRSFFYQGQNALYMPQCYEDGTNPTLLAKGPSAVAYEGGTYTASKASFFMRGAYERADCLVATDYKDPPIINDRAEGRYIVRRLTTTECARLQGFADWWGYIV